MHINERKWLDAIMASNRKLGIDHFKLDKLNKGEGSCLPIAQWESLGGDSTIFFYFACFYPFFNITFPIKLDLFANN